MSFLDEIPKISDFRPYFPAWLGEDMNRLRQLAAGIEIAPHGTLRRKPGTSSYRIVDFILLKHEPSGTVWLCRSGPGIPQTPILPVNPPRTYKECAALALLMRLHEN